MRRAALGMSQTKLAEQLGVTVQQLQKYESAKNRISASRLTAAARALGVAESFFFEAVGPEIFAGAHADYPILHFLLTGDGLKLNLAFARIRSRNVRQGVARLVVAIANASADCE